MTNSLTLHRILKAPRPLVWRCWTEPELLKQWFCPKPHRVTDIVIDLRPGGRFFTAMLVDGTEYPNDGALLEIVPQERIVFTDLMVADWQPVDNPGLGFTAEVIFRDDPAGTDYTATARHRTPADRDRHAAMGFHDGWGTVATQLEAMAQGLMQTQ